MTCHACAAVEREQVAEAERSKESGGAGGHGWLWYARRDD